MSQGDFHITQLHEQYAVQLDPTTSAMYFTPTLGGLGAQLLRRGVASGVATETIEITVSANMAHAYERCDECDGEGRVPEPGTYPAQFMAADGTGTFDFGTFDTKVCGKCHGTGLEIPGFFDDRA